MYEDPDMQSNDGIFFTDNSRRKVVVESQQDVTNDLFDALLEEEKCVQQKEEPGHDGAQNYDK
jgi:phage FluMu protein gp41